MNGNDHATRLQLWLAPYRSQVESAFDALLAAYEDDQLVDEFTAVGAHLLASMGAALGREKEIHPGILQLTRETPDPMQLAMAGTGEPFTGGPMYTFEGSTPSDAPNPAEWQLANVRTKDVPGVIVSGFGTRLSKAPLYKFHADIPVTDRRFTVWTGATEPIT